MGNLSDTTKEIEFKIDLGSFPNYLKLIGFLGAIEPGNRHINGFFDSHDHALSNAGWALRVRAENSRGLITVKGTAEREGLAVIRREIEAEISRGLAMDLLNQQADVMNLSNEPIEFVRGEFGKLALAQFICFVNLRQKKEVRVGEADYVFEIDRTEFSDGSIEYELELEFEDTQQLTVAENDLRHLFNSLDIPFVHQTESKLARALLRAGL